MPFLPDVIQLGPFPLATVALTGLVGGALAYLLAGRMGGPAAVAAAASDLVLNLLLGGLIGAKMVYVALDPAAYVTNPALLLTFPYGPLALPGGAIGALAAVIITLRSRPDRLAVLDQAAVPLALGLAVAVAGWKAPGSWAFAPLLLAAALAAAALARSARSPGHRAAAAVTLVACGLVVADIARPDPGLAAGVSGLQLIAALAGTAAWWWQRRTPET